MPYRLRFAALVMPTIMVFEMLALGADGPFLGATAAAIEILGAMIVIALLSPDSAFWRAFSLPLVLMALAFGWLASAALPGPDMLGRLWSAPDLLATALVRFAGGCGVLTAAAAVAWRRRGLRTTVDCWLVLGIVQLGVALALRQWSPDSIWGLDKGDLRDRFTGTFLNANAAGCLYAVLAVLALGRGLTIWRSRFEAVPLVAQIAAPIALLCGIGACAITGSRTALAACLLALVVVAARVGWNQRRSGRSALPPTLIAIGLAVGVAIVLILIGESTTDRLPLIDADGVTRLRIWTFYATLIADAPLGYGPNGLDDAALHGFRSIADAHLLWYVHSAHNVGLSLLITGGWPYLAAMASLVVALMLPFLRRRARGLGPLPLSILVALAVLLICASVDIVLDMPGMVSLGAMLAGLLWGRSAFANSAQSLLTARSVSTRAAAGEPATSALA